MSGGIAQLPPVLTPQTVKPVDIAIPNTYKWMYNGLFYSSEADFLDSGWNIIGTGSTMFADIPGRFELTTGAVLGNGITLSTDQRFALLASPAKDDLLIRGKGRVIANGVGDERFYFYGICEGNVDGATTSSAAFDAVLRGVGFVVNETQNGDNYSCICLNGAGGANRTIVDTSIAADSDHDLEIRAIAGGYEFYIDGVLEATITTDLPVSTTSNFKVQILTLTAASAERGDLRGPVSVATVV